MGDGEERKGKERKWMGLLEEVRKRIGRRKEMKGMGRKRIERVGERK